MEFIRPGSDQPQFSLRLEGVSFFPEVTAPSLLPQAPDWGTVDREGGGGLLLVPSLGVSAFTLSIPSVLFH